MLQDALGLIDSPLPGASWHTDALTAASFFVSTRLFLTGAHTAIALPPWVGTDNCSKLGGREIE